MMFYFLFFSLFLPHYTPYKLTNKLTKPIDILKRMCYTINSINSDRGRSYKMAKRRNAKGTGSIYKDNNGYWTAQIQVGIYPNGRPKYKRFKSKKQSEVIEKLNSYKIETNNLSAIAQGGDITTEEYVKSYLITYKKNVLKPSSYARDYRTYRNYIKEYIGYYKLSQLTAKTIQVELVNAMIQKDYSYSTVHKAYVLLNECLNKAVDEGKIITNPCKSVVQPSKSINTQKSIKFLNDDEIQIFLAEAKKDTYKNGYAIASVIYTGLRGGELCALKWKDVDFINKILNVEKNITTAYDYSNEENPIRIIAEQNSTKTSKGRVIPLSKSALSIFQHIKNSRPNASDDDYVLLSDSQTGMTSVDNVSNSYNSIINNTSIKGKTGIHTLRHTCASLLIRNGVDIKIVSEILGHTTVTFTYNTYVHIINEQKIKAMSVLDDI